MSRRGDVAFADVAFAAAACVVLAGYNNVVGLPPVAPAVVSGGQRVRRGGRPGGRGGQRADRGRPWAGAGSAGGRAQAGIGGGRAGRGRVRAGRADPGGPAPARRPAGRRAGPAPARLPGAAAHPGRHRRLGGDRVPRGAPGGAAPGAGRARGYRRGRAVFGLWHVRPTAEALAVNGLATGRGARIRRSLVWRPGRPGRARCCRCCGNGLGAWPRRCCCTWPPTARGRWHTPQRVTFDLRAERMASSWLRCGRRVLGR